MNSPPATLYFPLSSENADGRFSAICWEVYPWSFLSTQAMF
jgi:hypothetical protein